jgi:hypothetical protein
MEQFVLFGDSITQQSASQAKGFAWTPALQDGMRFHCQFSTQLNRDSIHPSPRCSQQRLQVGVFESVNHNLNLTNCRQWVQHLAGLECPSSYPPDS